MTGQEKFADTATATGWTMFLVSHALEWVPVLQFVSLLVSIVASIAAIVYYVRRIK